MNESRMVERAKLNIDHVLVDFIESEVIPGTGLTTDQFWDGLSVLIDQFGGRHQELLSVRASLQAAIDQWHIKRPGKPYDPIAYNAFLTSIGYLTPEGDDFEIETTNVDAEVATIAGPQLVVPSTNARYVLNAVNARWGSLYDALYGTDALGEAPTSECYDAVRGSKVIAWTRAFLDDISPLQQGSHGEVTSYAVNDGLLVANLANGNVTSLRSQGTFVGYRGDGASPEEILLEHNGLGISIKIDRASAIGATDTAGVADVELEAALTTIVDFEDSVATVDAQDKVGAYRTWLGLMKGDLTASVTKRDRTFERVMASDRRYADRTGAEVVRRGRSLLVVRNVGHLMTTPAVLDGAGNQIPEGILDAAVSIAIAKHDFARPAEVRNSPAGSVYIVKPKMHGAGEVALTVSMFEAAEELFDLPTNSVKIGIMDEERRTTVNLRECIRAAKSRVFFINTGFLDRTGDEIHTSIHAGPMVRKNDMKQQQWMKAYEDRSVDIGLACGFVGRAQIGKGMWAAPELMGEMLKQKLSHPAAGASCAWVPSPTAATLHATHYHRIDVRAVQCSMSHDLRASVDDVLSIPITESQDWTETERITEVDNNVQGILGYVVRWIDQGIGCSKVPDINGIALMEDRATCRISSQHVANWLLHDVVSNEQVIDSFRRMAAVVDEQNSDDPLYAPMAKDFDGLAFRAAMDLVFEGVGQPSGYTEPTLHRRRAQRRA